MRPFLTGILTLLFFVNLEAVENYPSGARSRALSNAFVSVSDTWSTFHNQAGIANLSAFSAGFYYESRFMIDELSLASASIVIPIKAGRFGLSFYQFGSGTFKQHKAGLAFAKKLSGKINAGVQLDYFSQRFPENDNAAGFISFEAGLIYSASNELEFGAHFFNPIKAGFETLEGKQEMPMSFRFGCHYKFPEMINLIFEADKTGDHPFMFKSGLEFSPAEYLILRLGISGKPVNYTAGIGIKTGKITTDIAFAYHGNLGVTPSVSIQFNY